MNLTAKAVTFTPISSTEEEDYEHPMLEIFRPTPAVEYKQSAKLYLVPTPFGDEYDPDFAPVPTSASELPELHTWTMRFAVSILEIWAGRRSPSQVTRMCHRKVFAELVAQSNSQKNVGRIRTLHQSEPLDGICESVITVRFEDRLRALVIRFEGVDGRWLCTELRLL